MAFSLTQSSTALGLDTYTNKHDQQDRELSKIVKYAQRKAITTKLANNLFDLYNLASYRRMLICGDTLKKQGDTVVAAHHCQHRLCSVCNAIKAKKFYTQYSPKIHAIGTDWWYVTLTRQNVEDHLLRPTVKNMKYLLKSILDVGNKAHRRIYKVKRFNGLQAHECTHNGIENTYHPHIHLLVHGEENAQYILDNWYRRCKAANIEINIDAQDLRPVNEQSPLIDIFKYSIKTADADTTTQAVHTMAQAYKNMQTIKAFGDAIGKLEDIQDEDITDKPVKFDPDLPYDTYKWYGFNWYNKNGTPLVPDTAMQFDPKTLKTLKRLTNTGLKIYRPSKAKYRPISDLQ